jgi:anaerobic magnesium-protoporphyrin IX monomethyl ester cyclase
MRIALIYPPPWKIPTPEEAPISLDEGGPEPGSEDTLDGDFRMVPFGLLSLAVQTMEAGHEVTVYNLSVFPWTNVVDLLHRTRADVYGLSCFTINRRGVDLISRAIRQIDPNAHITVGGPHATALAEPMLEHYPALDSVVIGEGESTFLELLRRQDCGRSPAGMAGLACRDAQHRITTGPRRDRIVQLDSLRSPLDYYASPILSGCVFQKAFCHAATVPGFPGRQRRHTVLVRHSSRVFSIFRI